MLSPRRRPVVALCVVAAIFGVARGDVVHLKGGGKVEGDIAVETSTTIVVNAADGKVSIDRSDIESIERSATSAPTPPTVRTGAHFRITCHFASDSCAEEALAAAESAWPLTLAVLGVDPRPVDSPLDIHLYRNPAEYAAVNAKLVGGVMSGYEGFCDRKTHSAHVRVLPDYDDVLWNRVGAPRDFVQAAAHEASHLTMDACFVNGVHAPEWLSEGVALHVEGQVAAVRGWRAADVPDVRESNRMAACLRLRKDGRLPGAWEIFHGRLARFGIDDRYAIHWAFFELLHRREHWEITQKLFADMRGMPAQDDFYQQLSALAEATWGRKGLDELNDSLKKYVDTFRPTWETQGNLDVSGGRWIEWTNIDSPAWAWRVAEIGRRIERMTGSFEIPAGSMREVSIDLGRSEAGFVAVIFNSTDGVRISEYKTADKSWHDVSGSLSGQPIVDAKSEFEIHVVGDSIHVALAGKEVASATLAGRDLSGPWGVGVHAGTTAIWTGVTAK